MTPALRHLRTNHAQPSGQAIGELAAISLIDQVITYPKPGLVSQIDTGAHHDMNAALLCHSAATLTPYFAELAEAGACGAGMERLRVIGIEAERAMLVATGGVNTHRGAIFGLGLLCAAAGLRAAYGIDRPLGTLITERWGAAILAGPVALRSHGAEAGRRYGAGCARLEATQGLPAVYEIALPALQAAREMTPDADDEAVRVQACMALIARVDDTNLLHRGGAQGLAFAQAQATAFVAAGGIAQAAWRDRAAAIHRAPVPAVIPRGSETW